MTETAASPSAPRGPQDPPIKYRNPVAAHPITSAACGLLVAAAICCTLVVPIYARFRAGMIYGTIAAYNVENATASHWAASSDIVTIQSS